MKTKGKSHKSLIVFILFGLGLYNFGIAQAERIPTTDTIYLNDDLLVQELPELQWIIQEGEQPLSVEDIRAGNIEGAQLIESDAEGRFSFIIEEVYWYKLVLKSNFSYRNQKLNINFIGGTGANLNTFEYVQANFYRQGQLIDEGLSGLGVGASKRDFERIFYPSLIEFNITKDLPLEVWVKLVSYKRGHLKITNEVVSHREDLLNLSDNRNPSFVYGCLVSFLLIGLFLWYWFREPIYVWFLVFIAVNFLPVTFYNYHNQIGYMLFPENPIFINKLLGLGDLFKFIITLLFGRVFINTKKYFPKTDRLLLVAIGVFFFLSVFALLLFDNIEANNLFSSLFFSIILLGIFTIIFILLYFIFSKNKLARFYSIGAITPFIAIIIVMFSESYGLYGLKRFAEQFIGWGPLIALGLAMVYRFKMVVEEKLNAEQESKKLLANQNTLLEQQVKERTSELNDSLTHLKATQSQLIQSEKMASLGELTAGIAHEIQNPLNFVNNFSEVSKELIEEMKEELDHGDKEEAKAIANDLVLNLEKINLHGKRADSIVKNMLQHSRTSSGKKEPTDVNALANEYLRLAYHASLASRKGMGTKDEKINASVETNFDESIGKINLVPQDIGRVLLNLINNAFYYVHEKAKESRDGYQPKVIISTKAKNDSVEIIVQDNGKGIPETHIDKIFQPFFTTKPTGQGTGLGLSLSYDIVKAHGGELLMESEEGKGSTFRVILTLPLLLSTE